MAVSLYTSNPKEVYELEWIIENVSFLPKVIPSPLFKPFSDRDESWKLEINYEKDTEVYLVMPYGCRQCFVAIEMNLYMMSYRDEYILTLCSYQPVLCGLDKVRCMLAYKQSNILERNILRGDKLKVKAKLIIAGHLVSQSLVSKFPALPPNEST